MKLGTCGELKETKKLFQPTLIEHCCTVVSQGK